ncbi:hypothetical protein M0813_17734 [Anaeramoeba flamelloides]|uniref:Uncharacterized protein n=1 Tax=Anaeramoeba flamelloides TaxID=1746091 RepID=A0ABQ8YV23_9EUKA|nr:hypothetical protein M0813_17734 [Anaeramoeba flamelloides]
MKTTVEGPGKIHFVAKLFEGYSTSNEMIFSIDGTIHREFYASDDWQEYDSYINSEGTHELKWTFRLEGVFDDEPRDFGYGLVDQVIFEKGSVGISLNEALDNDDLEFITGGNAAWYGQKEDSYYGKSAAKTDGLEEDQFTVLYFNVTGKGKVSFYWKVETWGDEDYLTFETDFETRFNISGNVDWTKATYKLETDDEHIVAWIFRKQSNADIDQGFGWVDKIVFSKDDDDVVSSANSILPLALAFFSSLFLFFSVLF